MLWVLSEYQQNMSQCMTKQTKWYVHSEKTQSLGIRPVWSEFLLSAWRKFRSLATHWVHSEDWSDWADAQADLSLCLAHMPLCWFCRALAHVCFHGVRRNIWIHNSRQESLWIHIILFLLLLFVCVEVLRPNQPNGVMLSVVSLPNHTFTGHA